MARLEDELEIYTSERMRRDEEQIIRIHLSLTIIFSSIDPLISLENLEQSERQEPGISRGLR